MADLTKLSETKFRAVLDKRRDAMFAANRALVDMGYGDKRHSEILDMIRAGELSERIGNAFDAFDKAVSEERARIAWHGSLKPIKRRA